MVRCALYAQNLDITPLINDPVKLSLAETTLKTSLDSGRSPFIISNIFISGNDKTKDFVIKRELPFLEGDSIALSELVEKFRIGKQQLINTRLFNEVVISLKSFRGYLVDVQVDVKERWYIFPIPYIKPVDRNLQVWASQGYSLSRLNFGAKFTYYNTTGRNDRLRLWLITGYSRQIQASYDQPFADKSLKNGYGINFNYAAQKEVNPLTINNQQFFLKADSIPKAGKFLQEVWGGSLQYTYRPGLKTRYLFKVGYIYSQVDSAVLDVNPTYLTNSGKAKVGFPEFTYTVTYLNVDYAAYPQRGLIGEATLYKSGLGKDMNMWSLILKGVKAWDLKWKSSFSIQANGLVRLPFEQPFVNQRLFGYGDFYLRGLEKYVVDGVAGVIVRNTARRELFKYNVSLPVRSRSHDIVPFRFYAKTYADFGYSYNKNSAGNSFANRFLYTAGAGMDIVTLYDIVLRFEYSINQFGQKGLYFHFKNDF
ncbi:POTRA domain-containing protein [Flavihumibacter fluvii]|uniref:POTRA domain-containing protein n=1 Tax=Flavihumibacter fluvii TaxID=2838157 RepID=UPI001BDE4DEF|nr:POTRA domain-containing protein [Flavihumibacter fluvii]ULQ52266.1 hypothetical protein KJS93_19440 [Flavihumibacter fluvii]